VSCESETTVHPIIVDHLASGPPPVSRAVDAPADLSTFVEFPVPPGTRVIDSRRPAGTRIICA
jgi:hypothetical protein